MDKSNEKVKHFEDDLIVITKKRCRLYSLSVPTLHLPPTLSNEKSTQTECLELADSANYSPTLKSYENKTIIQEEPRPSTSHSSNLKSDSSKPTSSQTCHVLSDNMAIFSDEDELTKITPSDTPRKRKLKTELSRLKFISNKRAKTIKTSYQNKRRLKKKVQNLNGILGQS